MKKILAFALAAVTCFTLAAGCGKKDNQLVIMFPGWNMGLKKDTKLYNKAKKTAKKYRVNKV